MNKLTLKKEYNDKNDEPRNWTKMFFSLPF